MRSKTKYFEQDKRIALVKQLLLMGYVQAQIVSALAPRFDVSPRTIRNYVYRAKEELDGFFGDFDSDLLNSVVESIGQPIRLSDAKPRLRAYRPQTLQGETRGKILQFIADFIQLNGYSPTLREIGRASDLKSTSVVAYHIGKLINEGKLTGAPTKSRTLRIVS